MLQGFSASAQKTVPYSSTIGDQSRQAISKEWTVINANDDGKKWAYSEYDRILPKTGYACGAIYERSLESPKDADDWVVSPAITLEAGKKYKLAWWTFTHGFKEAYQVVLSNGSDLNSLTGSNAQTLFSISDYMNYEGADHNIIVFTPETAGDYNIGFHCVSLAAGYRLYLTGFEITDFVLVPAAVTDLTAVNEGEEMSVALSWTLPTLDDTGAALQNGDITAIKVYRNDELIATLAGDATNYIDNSMTESGFYTYTVTAVAEGESVPATVQTNYVGPLAPIRVPYTADFSTADIVNTYWTFVDANNDGTTWKYYNANGTIYIVYGNMSISTVEDDWAITPGLYFPYAGEYKVVWNGYAYKGNMEFWLGGANTVDQMIIKFGELDEDDLASFSRGDKNLTVNIPDAGVYYIGIHNNQSPSKGIDYYMYGFRVEYGSGVQTITGDEQANDGVMYDLLGRRIVNPEKGTIYIMNGKKYIQK
jgi:hypothetical protein